MAKRFVDTDKFRKPFLRGLQGAYKLLWDYLVNDCNHAGIWIVDFEIAQIYIGADMQVNRVDALRFFNADKTRVVEIDNGRKWFIGSFIEFQYGELNPENRAHNSVISQLKNYDLWDENELKIKPLTSTLQAPYIGAMDMDKEKDMVKDSKGKDKGGTGGKEKPIEPMIVDLELCRVSGSEWKKDFEVYKSGLRKCYLALLKNPEWMAERKRLNPGVNIVLTLEKACLEFWSTEAGWENKKGKRTKTIDWKATLTSAISTQKNKVYDNGTRTNYGSVREEKQRSLDNLVAAAERCLRGD